jgi:hypothetical protein
MIVVRLAVGNRLSPALVASSGALANQRQAERTAAWSAWLHQWRMPCAIWFLSQTYRCRARVGALGRITQMRSPRFRQRTSPRAWVSDCAGFLHPQAIYAGGCCFPANRTASAPRNSTRFAAQYPAHGLPCERFKLSLAASPCISGPERLARLGPTPWKTCTSYPLPAFLAHSGLGHSRRSFAHQPESARPRRADRPGHAVDRRYVPQAAHSGGRTDVPAVPRQVPWGPGTPNAAVPQFLRKKT